MTKRVPLPPRAHASIDGPRRVAVAGSAFADVPRGRAAAAEAERDLGQAAADEWWGEESPETSSSSLENTVNRWE